jgi:DNA helicase II / ATP-dependent DNA helicase PcrA
MLDLSHLNKEQNEAVLHDEGPLLIVAGAGTGKTTVLTNRVAWLIEQGLAEPDEILCLTFTDKAAGEMEERIDALLPYGYVDLWVMTFHAFSERILRHHGIDIGLSSDSKLLDSTSQWMLVHEHIDQFHLDHYKPAGAPTKFISAMLTHFSRAKDEGIGPKEYLAYVNGLSDDTASEACQDFADSIKYNPDKQDNLQELWDQERLRRVEIANAYKTYQQLLADKSAFDFGDLILFVRNLFRDRPQILEKYANKFKYILVDEFQDTNWAQYDLVKMLAKNHQNITVVGDDDQSIYKFRGASLSNILGYHSDFPNAKQVVLTQNYRSTQNILDLSYQFIQNNNPHRLEYSLGQEKQDGAEEIQDTSSEIREISKELTAARKEKGVIEHLHYETLQEEAAGVVNQIIDLRKDNENLRWEDFVILVRANASAEPFLQALTLAEVPYQFMASQGLFSQPVIMDVISYLKLLDDYAESTALYRILILPTVDLENEDLMKLLSYAKKEAVSLREAMKLAATIGLTEKSVALCEDILEKVAKHSKQARTVRVSEVAMEFMDGFGLKQYYETLDEMQQADIYELLNHFWKFMQRFESENTNPTVKTFLAYIQLALVAGDTGNLPQDNQEGPDTVKIMTIHASKGLEFEHVFVANMVDRRFPTNERKDPIELPKELVQEATPGTNPHLEEERRLCYVALTRARTGLYLTSARDYGGARAKKPSRFLAEMGYEPVEPKSGQKSLTFGESFVKSFEAQKARKMDYKKYLPSRYSYSQLKTFQTCPWQYRYAHIIRIPVRGSYQASFGVSLHNALERFHRLMKEQDGVAPSKEFLLELYEEEWIPQWYSSPEHKNEMKEKGQQFLSDYYKKHKNNWPDVVEVEQSFFLKVGGHTIKGKIDRIDKLPDGKLRLVDYKSSKKKKTIDKDQLLIYQLAVQKVLEKDVGELVYYYLDGQDEMSFLGTDKQMEKMELKLVSTIEEIQTSDFAPTPSSIHCKYCDYNDICQYRILS